MKYFKILLLLFLFFLPPGELLTGSRTCFIDILNSNEKTVRIMVEIADTPSKQRKGLMYRKKLNNNEGMLFVFPVESYRNFWMKDTYIPLSIAYISSRGFIREIYKMKPLDVSKTYPSRYPAQYALEVPQGWFKKNKITGGCKVSFNGCIR